MSRVTARLLAARTPDCELMLTVDRTYPDPTGWPPDVAASFLMPREVVAWWSGPLAHAIPPEPEFLFPDPRGGPMRAVSLHGTGWSAAGTVRELDGPDHVGGTR